MKYIIKILGVTICAGYTIGSIIHYNSGLFTLFEGTVVSIISLIGLAYFLDKILEND